MNPLFASNLEATVILIISGVFMALMVFAGIRQAIKRVK